MSDANDIPKQDSDDKAGQSVADTGATTATDKKVGAKPVSSKQKTGRGFAMTSLAVAVIALLGSGYVVMQSTAQQQLLQQQLAVMGDRQQAAADRTKALSQRLTQQLATEARSNQASVGRLERFNTELQSQSRRLNELSTTDPRDWKLAEVEYLSRLANQRLHMGRDPDDAEALLTAADAILYQLKDTALYDVRQSFRHDIASLKAMPRFDLEGSYQDLVAMSEQISGLRLYDDPRFKSVDKSEVTEKVAEGWLVILKQRFVSAFDNLFSLVQVRSRDIQIESLPSAADTILLRQRLLLLVEQGKSSLLLGQQQVFTNSIDRLIWHIERNYLKDDALTQSTLTALAKLKGLNIAPELPDINRSQRSIVSYIEREHGLVGTKSESTSMDADVETATATPSAPEGLNVDAAKAVTEEVSGEQKSVQPQTITAPGEQPQQQGEH